MMIVNVSDLISLLVQNPKTCRRLDLLIEQHGQRATVRHSNMTVDNYPDKTSRRFDAFRRWLTGIVLEECDRLNIETFCHMSNGVKEYQAIRSNGITNDVETVPCDSRLEAGIVALEECLGS